MLEQQRVPQTVQRTQAAEGSRPPSAEDVRTLREQLARRTRQLEETELEYMDAMERAQRQAEILAVYAHDLRSPLSAIIGYAELLEMGVPESIPDCAVECVSRIRDAAHNLQSLLDELLARADTLPQLR